MNDRTAIQQMLEKIVVEKLYNRPYNNFDTNNLYGRWGKTNSKGNWKNNRFNSYQVHKMNKFGFKPNPPPKVEVINQYNQSSTLNLSGQQGGFQGGFQQGGFQQGGFQQDVRAGGTAGGLFCRGLGILCGA